MPVTVMPGVSSMSSSVSDRREAAWAMAFQSSSCRFPERILMLSICASEDSMRLASCSADISRLKTQTVFPVL